VKFLCCEHNYHLMVYAQNLRCFTDLLLFICILFSAVSCISFYEILGCGISASLMPDVNLWDFVCVLFSHPLSLYYNIWFCVL